MKVGSGEQSFFAPSRFIGYVANTFEKHEKNNQKHGTITSQKISKLFGEDRVSFEAGKIWSDLEAEFQEFCSVSKLKASGYKRSYFVLSDSAVYQDASEVTDPTVIEGAVVNVKVNVYERNPAARKACIDHFGFSCSVCDINLADRYGEIAEGFIHVHHLKPISEIKAAYIIDPKKDLRPVCPNCHSMLHRRTPPLAINELKSLLLQQSS